MKGKNLYSYICIIIYILLWIATYRKQRGKKTFGVSSYLTVLYLTWAVTSFLLYNNDLRDSYSNLTLFPFIYLYIMVILFMMPTIKYDNRQVNSIICPSRSIVHVFFIIYGACSLLSMPVVINQLISNFQIFLYDSNAGDTLYLINMSSSTSEGGISGLFGLASLIRNFFRECFIFFLFYYMSEKNAHIH